MSLFKLQKRKVQINDNKDFKLMLMLNAFDYSFENLHCKFNVKYSM